MSSLEILIRRAHEVAPAAAGLAGFGSRELTSLRISADARFLRALLDQFPEAWSGPGGSYIFSFPYFNVLLDPHLPANSFMIEVIP